MTEVTLVIMGAIAGQRLYLKVKGDIRRSEIIFEGQRSHLQGVKKIFPSVSKNIKVTTSFESLRNFLRLQVTFRIFFLP